jgi:hypothetical protein
MVGRCAVSVIVCSMCFAPCSSARCSSKHTITARKQHEVHSFVRPQQTIPSSRPADRQSAASQTLSRMPLAAPAKPARSVLDGGKRGATLAAEGRHQLSRVTARDPDLTNGRKSYSSLYPYSGMLPELP